MSLASIWCVTWPLCVLQFCRRSPPPTCRGYMVMIHPLHYTYSLNYTFIIHTRMLNNFTSHSLLHIDTLRKIIRFDFIVIIIGIWNIWKENLRPSFLKIILYKYFRNWECEHWFIFLSVASLIIETLHDAPRLNSLFVIKLEINR